jgi:ribosomal protein S27AE
MDIGSIFLILALLIPVVIYISRPLMERSSTSGNHPEHDISTLLAERDQVVATIKELDDDYNLGKIPTENYPTQRLTLLQNGAEILRKIDDHQLEPAGMTAEDRLEAAIVAHRLTLDTSHSPVRKNGNAVPPVPDDDLEQRIASRRRSMLGRASGFCPKCGRPVQVSDRFCPRCGATLA